MSTPDISIRRELERTRFDTGVGTGDLADRILVQLRLDGYQIEPKFSPLRDYAIITTEQEPPHGELGARA